MKRKNFTRLLSILLALAVLFGLLTVPAGAANLLGSESVTIRHVGRGDYLSKGTGGTIGGGYWEYGDVWNASAGAACAEAG